MGSGQDLTIWGGQPGMRGREEKERELSNLGTQDAGSRG